MTKIIDALREKYPTPTAVMRKLGLDESLLREDEKDMPNKDKDAREGLGKLLAQDASLAEMTEFLKTLNASGESGGQEGGFEDLDDEDDGEDDMAGLATEPNSGAPELGEKGEGDEPGEEVATDGPVGKLHSILKGKLSPEELAEVGECLEQIAGGEEAGAEEGEEAEHEEPGVVEGHEGEQEEPEEETTEGEDEDEEDDMNKDLVTKPAMDAAIQSAVAAERERAKGVDEAKRTVRPWVGELQMAFDSGEAVYRTALESLGIPGAKTIHPSALADVLRLTPRPGQPVAPAREVSLGMDSASADSFAKMFPNASRITLAH